MIPYFYECMLYIFPTMTQNVCNVGKCLSFNTSVIEHEFHVIYMNVGFLSRRGLALFPKLSTVFISLLSKERYRVGLLLGKH